jgi:hypothetical protein
MTTTNYYLVLNPKLGHPTQDLIQFIIMDDVSPRQPFGKLLRLPNAKEIARHEPFFYVTRRIDNDVVEHICIRSDQNYTLPYLREKWKILTETRDETTGEYIYLQTTLKEVVGG